MEAARGIDGGTGASRLPFGVTAHRRPLVFRRLSASDRPSRGRLATRVRRTGATGHSRRTADLGRAGAARHTTDPATAHHGTAEPSTAHHDAAGPAFAHRATNRGAAGSAAHRTDLRYAAWPTTRTTVGGGTVSHDTVCSAAGPSTARRSWAAGGAAGTDGFS
ncbi:hypothetical protein [Verrucosispora sp. WMMD573]|uniref:hypothetical protein n=1 Tax=Verrucosispora sp. WMMD573 TaxID=3015149 RepID=UPI00248CDBC4|nr:hypothetical protein [Verrucosispora sp. WMMD573]WBB57650.1 hypothetical protein O7601_25605 [Verrucosispora sp. WMMD573]